MIMEQIHSARDVAQMLCRGEAPDTLVAVSLADLQRMNEAAVITLRDQFACAYAAASWNPKEVYEMADAALAERNK